MAERTMAQVQWTGTDHGGANYAGRDFSDLDMRGVDLGEAQAGSLRQRGCDRGRYESDRGPIAVRWSPGEGSQGSAEGKAP